MPESLTEQSGREAGPLTAAAHFAAAFSFSAGPVGTVVQKFLTAEFDPFVIIAVQMSVGGMALWTISLLISRRTLQLSALAKGVLLGVVHPGAFMIAYTAGSARLDSITLVLILAFFPAATAITARLVLKESIRRSVAIGLAISLVGLVVLVFDRQATGESEPLGYALAFIGMACATSGVVAGRALNIGDQLPWYRLAPLQVTGAALVALCGAVAFQQDFPVTSVADQWPAFAYLALIMTAASYLAFNFALSKIPVPWLSIYIAAGPGVGAIAAMIVFGERLSPTAVTGIAVILLGAAFPHLWARLAAQPTPSQHGRSPVVTRRRGGSDNAENGEFQ